MQVLDEPADEHRALVVAQRDGVDCEPGELFDEGDEGLEVFFDREVEGVVAFDVYGDCGFELSVWSFLLSGGGNKLPRASPTCSIVNSSPCFPSFPTNHLANITAKIYSPIRQ